MITKAPTAITAGRIGNGSVAVSSPFPIRRRALTVCPSMPRDGTFQRQLQRRGPCTAAAPLAFDGPGNSANVTNQAAGIWQYLQVVVRRRHEPLGLGFAVDECTVGSPQMYVSRDTLPPASGVNFGLTTWPSGTAGRRDDWTGWWRADAGDGPGQSVERERITSG